MMGMNNFKLKLQNMYKINFLNYIFLLFILSITSCEQVDDIGNEEVVVKLDLVFSDQNNLVLRSSATQLENRIDNIYLLSFDKDKKYIDGEKIIEFSEITDVKVVIQTSVPLKEGGFVYVICNTYGVNLSNLNPGISTVEDIKTAFPCKIGTNWKINRPSSSDFYIPMLSGLVPWVKGTPVPTIKMYRAVSKVSLDLSKIQTDLSGSLKVNGEFDNSEYISWKLCNTANDGVTIYSEDGTSLSPGKGLRSTGYFKYTDNRSPYFIIPNNKVDKDEESGNIIFNKDRPYIMIKYNVRGKHSTPMAKERFFRLDFCDNSKTVNQYPELVNNVNYKFSITKVLSQGYDSEEEAAANAASNILYSIEQTDPSYGSDGSNGQYLLSTDVDNVYVIYLGRTGVDAVRDLYTNKFNLFNIKGTVPAGVDLPKSSSIKLYVKYNADLPHKGHEDDLWEYDFSEAEGFVDEEHKIDYPGLTNGHFCEIFPSTITTENQTVSMKYRRRASGMASVFVLDYGNVRKFVHFALRQIFQSANLSLNPYTVNGIQSILKDEGGSLPVTANKTIDDKDGTVYEFRIPQGTDNTRSGYHSFLVQYRKSLDRGLDSGDSYPKREFLKDGLMRIVIYYNVGDGQPREKFD